MPMEKKDARKASENSRQSENMAGNGSSAREDEENGFGGNKVLPFVSTPKKELSKAGNKKESSALSKMLGFQDLVSLKVWRASSAELLGTAVLVFMMDAIVISSYELDSKAPNLTMSILIAITVTILLLTTFPVSGGHMNPVISISAAFTGLISLSHAAVYISAQCAGAIIGALALKAVVNSTTEQVFSLGGCTVTVIAPGPNGPITVGLGTAQSLWLEIICTFIFLFASIWLAFNRKQHKDLGRFIIFSIIGLVVGLIVFVSTTLTATKGYAGVGMNPARCLGPAVVRGGHLWAGHWIFWAGPVIACVAFGIYAKIIPQDE